MSVRRRRWASPSAESMFGSGMATGSTGQPSVPRFQAFHRRGSRPNTLEVTSMWWSPR